MTTVATIILQLGGGIIRIPGDGNCGLACLQRLLPLELCVYSIYDIRIRLCDEMEKLGISSVNMRIDGTWINEGMFMAACRLFRVNIIIINNAGYFQQFLYANYADNYNVDNDRNIKTIYINGNGVDEHNQTNTHFDAIELDIPFDSFSDRLREVEKPDVSIFNLNGEDDVNQQQVEDDARLARQLAESQAREARDADVAMRIGRQEENDARFARQLAESQSLDAYPAMRFSGDDDAQLARELRRIAAEGRRGPMNGTATGSRCW